MAAPDPRLAELISALAEAGVSWLSVEILDAVRQGRPPEESREALVSAQRAVRARTKIKPDVERPPTLPPEPSQFYGDDQIDYAVAYVVDRLTDAIATFQASLDQLDKIALYGDQSIAETVGGRRLGPAVALQIGEEGAVIDRIVTENVQQALAMLKSALHEWAVSTRRGGPQ